MFQDWELRGKVRQVYSAMAEQPAVEHPIPVGRTLAENLGYPPQLLSSLPSLAVDAFAGVSNVSVFAEIHQGATVLDLGCGAGMDSLIAAVRCGPLAKVIGIDFSRAMLERARAAVAEAAAGNVVICEADAEHLPLATAAVDVALVNGIFNLNPARDAIFRELGRVVRPGGAVFASELLLREPLPPEVRTSEADWFA